MRTKGYLYGIIIVMSINTNINCKNKSAIIPAEIPTVDYKMEFYIDQYKEFNNTGLGKVPDIVENPVAKEFVVADDFENCIYFFDRKGEFIKQIGQKGQGPGDLMGPQMLHVDNDGDIYVYESDNMRISIFTKEGDFITSFRARLNYSSSIFVKDNKEILTCTRLGEYFITVYNRQGDVVREIGKVPESMKKYSRWQMYKLGLPYYVNNKYYMFYLFLRRIDIWDDTGNFIESIDVADIFSDYTINDPYTPLEQSNNVDRWTMSRLIQGVFYSNGHFFIKSLPNIEDTIGIIVKLDQDFNIIKEYTLHGDRMSLKHLPKFIVYGEKDTFLLPTFNDADIIRMVEK
ncbi:6-bladed beta-propeller [candidate division KSB1 bacterium]